MVHRERARVDAILTGMGTVITDDPVLTVRGTRARRVPLRVVWDPRLLITDDRALVRTAREVPVLVACTPEAFAARAAHAEALRAAGVDVRPVSGLRDLLRSLAAGGASTVLVEAGAGLVGALLQDGLVNDAWVFTAPHAIGDAGPRSMAPMDATELAPLECIWNGVRGGDRVAIYRFPA